MLECKVTIQEQCRLSRVVLPLPQTITPKSASPVSKSPILSGIEGKHVKISGRVEMYKGKPEIRINAAKQLDVERIRLLRVGLAICLVSKPAPRFSNNSRLS